MTLRQRPIDHADRNERAARFIAEYRAVPYCVLDTLFFDGKTCGNALSRLSKSDPNDPARVPLVHVHRNSLPGRLSYATPTAAGCRAFGVSEKRAEPPGTAALNLCLGISFFCAMDTQLRFRITRSDVVPLLGKAAPRDNVPHVIMALDEPRRYALLRVYQAVSDVHRCEKHLRRLAGQLIGIPTFAPLVKNGEYALAMLAATPSALRAIEKMLTQSGLSQQLTIVCGLGPTAETLGECLAMVKGKTP